MPEKSLSHKPLLPFTDVTDAYLRSQDWALCTEHGHFYPAKGRCPRCRKRDEEAARLANSPDVLKDADDFLAQHRQYVEPALFEEQQRGEWLAVLCLFGCGSLVLGFLVGMVKAFAILLHWGVR